MKSKNKPIVPTKKEIKEYRDFLNEAGKNFKLTEEDLSNLTDLSYMVCPDDIETFKLNKINKWFERFFGRIEEITLADKKDYQKILKKLKKIKW